MMTILSLLVGACASAWATDHQPALDQANADYCEEVGRSGPDGGHIKAWANCLREAGLTE